MADERYINAIDLAENIENLDITVAGKPARWNDAKYTVLKEIAEAPTADVVPKVTAKWGDPIFVGDAWAVPCPRCFYATAIRHKVIRPRYCSNCGAEMNGEEQKPDPRLLEGYRDGLLIAISGELHIPIDVLLKISTERERAEGKQ